MTLIEQICTVAAAYGEARKLSVGRVSTLVFNDGTKLGALMDGRADITTARFEKAMTWFSANWPDCEWPASVSRPWAPTAERHAS